MTTYTKFTMTEAQADAVVAETGARFRGRAVSRIDATTIEIGASRADLNAFAAIVAKHKRGGISADDAATSRQIAFLRDLVRTENAYLAGITADHITDNLTKSEASRLIGVIQNWA